MNLLQPETESDACALIVRAQATGVPLSIQGGGTRVALGRPTQTEATLSTAMLTGITLFEPAEMVISARAGTPVAVIERALAAKGQMLPFEPMDHRRLMATQGNPTIGGVFAGNISGPARVNRGACRDSAIGVRLINGRGENIKSGGRVMKNVTGLDLTKLACGSFGTLGLVTEVSFKVLPRPERSVTLVLSGLNDREAVEAMFRALGSPFEPSGAAHLPAGVRGAEAQTLIRIENFSAAVEYRIREISRNLKELGRLSQLEGIVSDTLWQAVRDAEFLAEPHDQAVWRLSTAPSRGPDVVDAVRQSIPEIRHYYDWGGGLIWLGVPGTGDAGATVIHASVAAIGGHAMLVRASAELRAVVDVFQPLGQALRQITAGLKASFDPKAILEPGRMYVGI